MNDYCKALLTNKITLCGYGLITVGSILSAYTYTNEQESIRNYFSSSASIASIAVALGCLSKFATKTESLQKN